MADDHQLLIKLHQDLPKNRQVIIHHRNLQTIDLSAAGKYTGPQVPDITVKIQFFQISTVVKSISPHLLDPCRYLDFRQILSSGKSVCFQFCLHSFSPLKRIPPIQRTSV